MVTHFYGQVSPTYTRHEHNWLNSKLRGVGWRLRSEFALNEVKGLVVAIFYSPKLSYCPQPTTHSLFPTCGCVVELYVLYVTILLIVQFLFNITAFRHPPLLHLS